MTWMRKVAAVAALALALGVAACGGEDGGSTASEDRAVGAQTGQAASDATSKGEQDAGQPVELPPRTVGFLQYTNEAEIARRMQTAAEEATKALGWKFISCDGQGDPRKQGACGSTLLDRGADVILANTIPAAVSKRALRTADEKGIPWIVVGGVVPEDPLIDAIYPPDDKAMSAALSKWLMDELGSGDHEIAVMNTFPGIEGYTLRQEALEEAVQAQPGTKIVAKEEVDYTNLVEDVRRDVSQTLGRSPNVDAIFSITNDIPPIVQGLRGAGKTADNGPIVTGFFGDQANLDAIRDGWADAVAEWPNEGDIWAALDSAAQLLAREKPLPATVADAYSINYAQPTVVTKENLPAEGEYPAPAADFVSYFKAKWGKEFGGGGA